MGITIYTEIVAAVLSGLAPIGWQLEFLILNMMAIAAVLPQVFTFSLRNDPIPISVIK